MKMVKLLMSMALAMTLSVQMNNAADISTIKQMPAITISSGNLDDVKQSELAGKHHDNAMKSAFDPYLEPETKWTWSEQDLAMTFGESGEDAGHYIKTSGFLRYSEKKLCSFAERFKTAINAAKEQNAITAGYECLPKLLEAFEKCVKEATTKIDLTPAQKASLFIRIAALLDYVNDELFVNNFTKTYPFNEATSKEDYKENFAAKIKTVKDALWDHLDLPKIVDEDTISTWLESNAIKANSRTWGVRRYFPSNKTVCAILSLASLPSLEKIPSLGRIFKAAGALGLIGLVVAAAARALYTSQNGQAGINPVVRPDNYLLNTTDFSCLATNDWTINGTHVGNSSLRIEPDFIVSSTLQDCVAVADRLAQEKAVAARLAQVEAKVALKALAVTDGVIRTEPLQYPAEPAVKTGDAILAEREDFTVVDKILEEDARVALGKLLNEFGKTTIEELINKKHRRKPMTKESKTQLTNLANEAGLEVKFKEDGTTFTGFARGFTEITFSYAS